MNDIDVLDDPALTGLVAELRAVGAGAPPPVGDELEALFTGNAIPISSRRGRRVAVIALVGAAALGGTLGTAAADSLPNPAQRFVSDVIGILTPFDLPTPADKVKPSPKAPAHLTPTPAPQPTSHASESGDDSGGSKGSDDRGDDSGSTSDDHSGSSGSSGSDDSSSTSGSGPSGTSGSSGSDDTSGTSGSGTSGSGTSGSGSDDSTSGHSGSDDKTSDSSSSGGSTDD
jgi:hypothetical protein